MKIPYIDLGFQHLQIKDELMTEIEKLIISGQFVLGDNVKRFEEKFASTCETKFAVGVANGTDALVLAMKALGIGDGDEVITTPNSFLASASSIALVGATPVFVDVRDDFNMDPDLIESAITSKTKAIMPVHLTGKPADMDSILQIASQKGLYVIEDAAQAIGAEYKNKKVGSLGTIGCFSLHPLKNLSAIGDGGVITINDENIYRRLLLLRNHGLKNRDECVLWGLNSRLDSIQSVILQVKLNHLQIWTLRRREIANRYQSELKDIVIVPSEKEFEKSVYHTFIIQTDQRDALMDFLANNNIDTKVHYPIPIHLQEAAKYLGYQKGDFHKAEKQCGRILSLPIFPELKDAQIDFVIKKIKEYFKSK
jgi:dTDP-4-amino-4,6-dideoxygalactose transaminase